MKTVSTEYAGKEEATKRKPIELFHIYDNVGIDEFFCSSDIAVVYDGDTYNPASVYRGEIEYNAELEISKMVITTDYLNPAVSQFIATNPPQAVWVKCLKLFSDMSPYEADVIFVGQISTVSISGTRASATVVGFEMFLNRPACVLKYQNQCNYTLFETGCGLLEASYAAAKTVDSVSSDGLTVVVTSMSEADGYYSLGYMKEFIGGYAMYRMIVSHSGTSLRLRFKFPTDPTGAITIYPGCDGDIITCTDKFSNEANFLGFPYIPEKNPTRTRLTS